MFSSYIDIKMYLFLKKKNYGKILLLNYFVGVGDLMKLFDIYF